MLGILLKDRDDVVLGWVIEDNKGVVVKAYLHDDVVESDEEVDAEVTVTSGGRGDMISMTTVFSDLPLQEVSPDFAERMFGDKLKIDRIQYLLELSE